MNVPTLTKIVFMVEERSMAALLDRFLPDHLGGVPFQCIPHQGKNDLRKSIPRKLRAWKEPGTYFVILQDQDEGDCRAIKNDLSALCHKGGRTDCLIRIVCRELEAWYLGIPDSLADAFSIDRENIRIRNLKKSKYSKNPDEVSNPSKIIKQAIPDFGKVKAATLMAKFLSKDNPSKSLQAFIDGVERLVSDNTFRLTANGERRSLAGSGRRPKKRG